MISCRSRCPMTAQTRLLISRTKARRVIVCPVLARRRQGHGGSRRSTDRASARPACLAGSLDLGRRGSDVHRLDDQQAVSNSAATCFRAATSASAWRWAEMKKLYRLPVAGHSEQGLRSAVASQAQPEFADTDLGSFHEVCLGSRSTIVRHCAHTGGRCTVNRGQHNAASPSRQRLPTAVM